MTHDLTPRLCFQLKNFAEPPTDWSNLLAIARAADANGIDKLVAFDHVAMGERLDEYGRPEAGGLVGGTQPTGPDGDWLEPLTLLAVIAGMTTRVRLGTHVLLAALRRPVVLAKVAATLDVLSGGRLDLGVGVGWQREEYEAAGLDFERRGRLLDESLTAIAELWRERVATLSIDGRSVSGIHQMPKPVQPGGVPIWVSGRVNQRVADRLVRFGHGWIPWGDDAVDLSSSIPRLWDLVRRGGADPSRLRVVGTMPIRRRAGGDIDIDASIVALLPLLEVGVTDVVLRVDVDVDSASETFAGWSNAFRAATRH